MVFKTRRTANSRRETGGGNAASINDGAAKTGA